PACRSRWLCGLDPECASPGSWSAHAGWRDGRRDSGRPGGDRWFGHRGPRLRPVDGLRVRRAPHWLVYPDLELRPQIRSPSGRESPVDLRGGDGTVVGLDLDGRGTVDGDSGGWGDHTGCRYLVDASGGQVRQLRAAGPDGTGPGPTRRRRAGVPALPGPRGLARFL
ncbi:uncharacterized protein METZ01_LOCUS325176, partial [marine metagenome]